MLTLCLLGSQTYFNNINILRKICKIVTMATQGCHHGALQNFSYFLTVVPFLSVCIFVQNKFNILKLNMFMKEHMYFDMFDKFGNFLKHNLENIEILGSVGIFSNDVNWRHCELPRSSFGYRFTNFMVM